MLKFIKDNASCIVWVIAILFFCATFVIPLFVAMGHYLWDIAINNPAELFN